jgi:hypothetical protein
VAWEPLVWSSFVRQLEGHADRELEVIQWQVWRYLVISCPHSAGDGAAVPGMEAQRRGWLSVRNVVPTLTSNKRQGLSLNGRC